MSLIQNVFSFLFPSTAATAGHRYPQGGHNRYPHGIYTSNKLIPGLSHKLSSLPLLGPQCQQLAPPSQIPEHVERSYGLSLLIAKSIGLPSTLGLLSRCTILTNSHSRQSSGATTQSLETPASGASLPLPATPVDQATNTRQVPHFARATPPQLRWRVPSSRPSQHSQCIEGPFSPDVKSSFLDLNSDDQDDHSSPASLSFFSDDEASPVDPLTAQWLQNLGSSFSPFLSLPDPSPPDFASYGDSMELPVAPVWDPIVLGAATTSSARPPSRSDTEPAVSRRASPALESLSGVPSDLRFSHLFRDSAFGSSANRKKSLPASVLPSYDPYNENRVQYADTVSHRGVSYQVLGTLGEGGFSRVFLAVTNSMESVALKVVHKRRCYRTPHMKACLQIERDCMEVAAEKSLPVWVSLRAAWEDDENVYFAMDPSVGSLVDCLKLVHSGKCTLSKDEIRLMCAEMLLALRDLRDHEVVHGDIKPDNFLLTRTGRVILSDFGLAQRPSPNFGDREAFVKWRCLRGGTAGYMAPEVIKQGYCSHETDIYSLGLVCMELMAGMCDSVWNCNVVPLEYPGGRKAWKREAEESRQLWLMENLRFSAVSERALPRGSLEWDLCMQMLCRRPVEELMAHEYFRGLKFEDVYEGRVTHDHQPTEPRQLRVEPAMRDLTFTAWHRGHEPDDCYDDEAVILPVEDNGAVIRSGWLVDTPSCVAQMAEPLGLDFEWPPIS